MNAEFNAIENSPLMRKTKTQLVEIILRKDEVEKELRETIKSKINDVNVLNNKFDDLSKTSNDITQEYEKLNKHFDVLKSNYEDMCDEHITTVELLKRKVKLYKDRLKVSVIMFVVFFLAMGILLNI